MKEATRFFEEVAGLHLECAWYPADPDKSQSSLVLLHEGLGSVAMWRDFPARLAEKTGYGVFVYSRYGYGWSTPCTTHPVGDRYMHREALEVLPELLDRCGFDNPILIGHSDGGSIALIYAGGSGRQPVGVVTLAAHVFNDEVCTGAIDQVRKLYETTNLKDKLARYHEDPEGAFRLWNEAWLAPSFQEWNIEEYLPGVTCPVLALQGEQDEYGVARQLESIVEKVQGPVSSQFLSDCGHSPHRDQTELTLSLISDFLKTLP